MARSVFIAGATGFIGIRVCRILKENGYTIHAHLLHPGEREYVAAYSDDFITGDLLKEADLQNLRGELKMRRAPFLISLVGSVDYAQGYGRARTLNVDTAHNLAGIASDLNREGILKKMVFVGSIASRGFLERHPGSDRLLNEEESCYLKGRSVYCDVKHEAEELINQMTRTKGLPAVIVEPGSLVGAAIGGRTTTNIGLVRKIMKGVPVLRGGASYASVNRVAEGIVLALEKGKVGETYLLGGENMAMKEFALFIREQLRTHFPDQATHLPIVTIPRSLSLFLGSMNIVMNRQQALLGNAYHFIDSSKAKRELGYRHSIDDLKLEIGELLRGVLGPKA